MQWHLALITDMPGSIFYRTKYILPCCTLFIIQHAQTLECPNVTATCIVIRLQVTDAWIENIFMFFSYYIIQMFLHLIQPFNSFLALSNTTCSDLRTFFCLFRHCIAHEFVFSCPATRMQSLDINEVHVFFENRRVWHYLTMSYLCKVGSSMDIR